MAAPTITRVATNLAGTTPGTPASVAAGGGTLAPVLDLEASAGTLRGLLTISVAITGSPPTAAPTIQWAYSEDGTNYHNESYVVTCDNTASRTTAYSYRPPSEAVKKIRGTLTNGGATNAINAFAQGVVLTAT